MGLREGWNFEGDIATRLELIGRNVFGFDLRTVTPTIFESAAISMGSFVNVLGLVLRKVTNYKTNDEVDSFINEYKEYIGLDEMHIKNEKSDEIFTSFIKLYEKYR